MTPSRIPTVEVARGYWPALVLGLLAWLTLVGESTARAQSSPPRPLAEPTRSRAALEQQYRQSPDPELLAQLALAYEREGRLLTASDLARRYLAQQRQALPEALSQSLAPLRSRPLPLHCEVGVFADRPSLGAVVLLDDHPVGITDIQDPRLQVSPGAHTLRLEQRGQQGREQAIDCPPRRRVDVRLSLDGERSPSTAPWYLLLLVDDQLPADQRDSVRRAISSRLEEQNVLVLPFDSPELAAAPIPRFDLAASEAPCPELACLAPTLDAVGAQWALHIQRPPLAGGPAAVGSPDSSPPSWHLRLRDHRVRQGFYQDPPTPGARPPKPLPSELAERSLALISGPAHRQPVSLRIDSQPSPAALYINEQAVGNTPFSASLYRQSYRAVARRPGYLDASQTWPEDEIGNTLQATLTLQRDPVVARRRAIKLGIGWTTLALGGLSLALGAALWAIDGQEFNCDETGALCQRRYTTQTLGISGVALGGALLGVAGLSLGLAAREPK